MVREGSIGGLYGGRAGISSPLTDSAIRRVVQLEQTLAALQIDNEALRAQLSESQRKHDHDISLIRELRDVSVAASLRSTQVTRELDTAMTTMKSLRNELLRTQTEHAQELAEKDLDSTHLSLTQDSLKTTEATLAMAEQALVASLEQRALLQNGASEASGQVTYLKDTLEKEGAVRRHAEMLAASLQATVTGLQTELQGQADVEQALRQQLMAQRTSRSSFSSSCVSASDRLPQSPTSNEQASALASASFRASTQASQPPLIALQQIARAVVSALESDGGFSIYDDSVRRAVEQLSSLLLMKDGRGKSERNVDTVIDSVSILSRSLRNTIATADTNAVQGLAARLAQTTEHHEAALREVASLKVQAVEGAIKVQEAQTSVFALQGEVDALKASSNDDRAPTEELEAAITEMHDELASSHRDEQQTAALRARVAELEAKQEDHTRLAAELESLLSSRKEDDTRTALLTKKVSELQSNLELSALLQEEAVAKEEMLQNMLKENEARSRLRVTELETECEEHRRNMEAFKQAGALSHKVSEMQSTLELAALREEDSTEKIKELENRLETSEMEISRHEEVDEVAALQRRVVELEAALSKAGGGHKIHEAVAQRDQAERVAERFVLEGVSEVHSLHDIKEQRNQAERAAEGYAMIEGVREERSLQDMRDQRDQAERLAADVVREGLQRDNSLQEMQSQRDQAETLAESMSHQNDSLNDIKEQLNQAEKLASTLADEGEQQNNSLQDIQQQRDQAERIAETLVEDGLRDAKERDSSLQDMKEQRDQAERIAETLADVGEARDDMKEQRDQAERIAEVLVVDGMRDARERDSSLQDMKEQRDQAERIAESAAMSNIQESNSLQDMREQRDQAERIAGGLVEELEDHAQSSSTVVKTLREQVEQLASDNSVLQEQRDQAERALNRAIEDEEHPEIFPTVD